MAQKPASRAMYLPPMIVSGGSGPARSATRPSGGSSTTTPRSYCASKGKCRCAHGTLSLRSESSRQTVRCERSNAGNQPELVLSSMRGDALKVALMGIPSAMLAVGECTSKENALMK